MNPRRSTPLLGFFFAALIGIACSPTRTCPGGQSLCADICTDVAIDAKNCGTCGHGCAGGEACQAGSCHPCDQGDCTPVDLYAVCFSGSLTGYHTQTGRSLPPFTV